MQYCIASMSSGDQTLSVQPSPAPNQQSSVRADGLSAEEVAWADTILGMSAVLGGSSGTIGKISIGTAPPLDPAEVERLQLEEEKVLNLDRSSAWLS